MADTNFGTKASIRGGKDFLTVLSRGLAVLEAFSTHGQKMTLAEAAKSVGLPRATARRCLLTLEELGYVESNGRHFALTPKVLTISRAFLSSNSLLRIAQPFLDRISAISGTSCAMGVFQDDFIIHVASSSNPTLSNIRRGVGAHLPAYCTSMGRVMLAHSTPDELDDYFEHVELIQITPKTIFQEEGIRLILRDVVKNGYCYASGETSLYIQALAVPVYNNQGKIKATLGIMNVKDGMEIIEKEDFINNNLPVLRKASEEMGALLVD